MKRWLQPWEEIVGVLKRIRDNGDRIIAEIGNHVICLPKNYDSKLEKLIGRRIGILRTDIPGKEYLIAEGIK